MACDCMQGCDYCNGGHQPPPKVAEVLTRIACPDCGSTERIGLERAAIFWWSIKQKHETARLDDCPDDHEEMSSGGNDPEVTFSDGSIARLGCANFAGHADGKFYVWECPAWVLDALEDV